MTDRTNTNTDSAGILRSAGHRRGVARVDELPRVNGTRVFRVVTIREEIRRLEALKSEKLAQLALLLEPKKGRA